MALNISRNSRGRNKRKLLSEINVTPMVDVMLVLMIIFMLTSPMLVAGVEVDLPETDSKPVSGDYKPLVISINKQGEIFIMETKIPPSELLEKLKNLTKEKKDHRIFIKGDKNIPYGKVVELMAEITNAGFTRVALVSNIKSK